MAPFSLTNSLPGVRGRISGTYDLSAVTWFRVGGPAQYVYKPADLEDLQYFLANRPVEVPLTVIGVGSNLLVRDGGVNGFVIRLGRAFANVEVQGTQIRAGAGALDLNVALGAQQAGLGGVSFLSGIPGTIGGALRMNAGAYAREIKDVLVWAEALAPDGTLHRLSAQEMGFSYRKSGVPADWIFIRACLQCEKKEKETVAQEIKAIQNEREASQPVRARTGGSTFKNPNGAKAWQVIDAAGCRGLTIGDAMVSEKHCNFLINTDKATAHDLEALGEEVRKRVHAKSGIRLDWEIKRIGKAL